MGSSSGYGEAEVTEESNDYRLEKHSLPVAGHRTSVTLERAFWRQLQKIAKERDMALSALVTEIDQARASIDPCPNLSSAIRVYLLHAAQP